MVSSWPEYPLSSFIDSQRAICYGIVQPGQAHPDGVPIIRVNNFKDGRIDTTDALRISPAIEQKYQRSRLKGGELLVTLVGTMGLSAIAPENLKGWNVARAVGVLPIRKNVDKRWINFVIRSQPSQQYIQLHANTTVQATFNLRDLAQLPVPMPPDHIRMAASGLLSALDDKIDCNRRMNETLEAMARAMFKDWFVDFGPTKAKMEGRAPYLAPEIWDLFPDRLDDEGKPKGWTVVGIGEEIELLDSKRIPLSSRERASRPGKYPYHGATGVMDYVDDYLFEEVLLLVGEDGSVVRPDGHPYTQYVWGKIWVNNHAHVIKGKTMSVEQLKCFFDLADIAPYVTGAVQPKLNQGNLKRIKFTKASKELHLVFDRTISPLFSQIRLNTEETRPLAQTRDLLLPKLMSGEIRVKDAERAVEDKL